MLRVDAKDNIGDPEALKSFITQAKWVDPSATGQPLQNHHGSRQIKRSYFQATASASLAVFLVLWWDPRRPTRILLAVLPPLLDLLQLFGLMGWLQIPLNPANIVVLPLLVDIGIDDGIHVVHDWQQKQGKLSVQPATAHGIMTSLTLMIGFGTLMLAQQAGLCSVGRVVTHEVTCCLLTSLV